MAFDFFNISGSLFVETQISEKMRGSAQGLFMMMVNGFGALFGSFASGLIIQKFFTFADQSKDWRNIWITFALYTLALAVVFPFIFKYKHNKAEEPALQGHIH
jgi:NHS family xanthosine MFS transporter